jgi:hypothetical protein
MALPEYWWLLALACVGQALYFLRPDAFRRAPSRAPAWALAGMGCGGLAGLAYGLAQSDPLLVAGQTVVLAGAGLLALNQSPEEPKP